MRLLPSLGEADIVFSTSGELYPGVVTDIEDTLPLRRLKGDMSVLDLLVVAVAVRHEVRDRRSLASAPPDRTWTYGLVVVDDEAQELSAMD